MRNFALLLLVPALFAAPDDAAWQKARANGAVAEDVFARTRRMVENWLSYADPQTLLLPDYLPGRVYPNKRANNTELIYTPHNSGADNYPYLIVTSFFTAPELYRGRMMDMLRSEIRYTNAGGAIPGNLDLKTHKLGPPSFFGAGEYCKDGLLSVTELLGRTPWYYRMVDIMQAFMERAPVKTRFGNLPDTGAELNGDVLQTLVRAHPHVRRPALPRVGRADRRRVRGGNPARTISGCPATATISRRRPTPAPRACATTATRPSWASRCCTPLKRTWAARARRNTCPPCARCSTACWPRPTRTACSITKCATKT